MKRLIIGLLTYLFCTSVLFAQSRKPQVLIFGSDAATFSAAMQSALSGVQTLWITDKQAIMPALTAPGVYAVQANKRLDAGMWARFLQEIANADIVTDSILQRTKERINGQLAANAVNKMIDSTVNLTRIDGVTVTQLSKTRNRWKVRLSNNQSFKIQAIVDGSSDQTLKKWLDDDLQIKQNDTSFTLLSTTDLYASPLYRTSLLCYALNGPSQVISYPSIIQPVAENFFAIQAINILDPYPEQEIDNIPLFMLAGQAIGASAAYSAFFKTTTDKINIRRLQGELLAYNGQLIPFEDIKHEDKHYGAIQRIGATGIFKGIVQPIENTADTLFRFQADARVSAKEIQPIIQSLFTRSQIWFQDKELQQLQLQELLDLIKFTALKGDEVNKEVERGWIKKFHFTGQYDPETFVDRRKAAVLLDYYLRPFDVNIDRNGKFVY